MRRCLWIVAPLAFLIAVLVSCEADTTKEQTKREPGETTTAKKTPATGPSKPRIDPMPSKPTSTAVEEEPEEVVEEEPEVVEEEPEARTIAAPTTAKSQTPQEAPRSFHPQAFPPVMPDSIQHADAWMTNDCMRCHETGVFDAPTIVHEGMPEILKKAKCRTCHVQIKGAKPRKVLKPFNGRFAPNAFPPMIPASQLHPRAWMKDDCLLCHETGNSGAPVMVHEGLPAILKQAKCRTCHVQVRVWDASRSIR